MSFFLPSQRRGQSQRSQALLFRSFTSFFRSVVCSSARCFFVPSILHFQHLIISRLSTSPASSSFFSGVLPPICPSVLLSICFSVCLPPHPPPLPLQLSKLPLFLLPRIFLYSPPAKCTTTKTIPTFLLSTLSSSSSSSLS